VNPALIRLTVVAWLASCCAAPAIAQPAKESSPASKAEPPAAPVTPPRHFRSTHTGVFNQTTLTYIVTAEDTLLHDAAGHPTAALFSFSYVRQGVKDPSSRPVLFVFNGGPGSSSLWVHVGALGPRKVSFEDALHPPTVGPFHLRDNPSSPLDATDLVFIDPVGTGYSHLIDGGKPEQYYGVMQDAKATAEFIVSWLTRNKRWSSPKFLLGESYGTIRVPVLLKVLAGGPMGGGTLPGVSFNGAILLGTALDPGGASASQLSLLPTLAATAWYHGKIDKTSHTLAASVSEAQSFAASDYGSALYAGNRLSEAQRRVIATRLAGLTGLSEGYLLEHDLRVSAKAFGEELLRDRGQALGMYDARYTLPRDGSGGDPVADDPAMAQYVPAFVAVFQEYVQNELNISIDEPYQAIAFADVNAHWDWGPSGFGGPYASDLAAAMRRTPAMRLLVGSGYYDLTTPFGTAEYALTHVPIPAERLVFKTYESGHMVYLGDAPAREFDRDLREFVSK
jgi:carboxypeptidase C (cathepsin A)